MKELQELFNEVKKKFPEINAKLIKGEIISIMASRPFGKNIIYNSANLKKYNFSELALKGLLAHELAHKIQAKRAGIIEKIKVFLYQKFKLFNNKEEGERIEREADKIAMSKGFKKEIKTFYKEKYGK